MCSLWSDHTTSLEPLHLIPGQQFHGQQKFLSSSGFDYSNGAVFIKKTTCASLRLLLFASMIVQFS